IKIKHLTRFGGFFVVQNTVMGQSWGTKPQDPTAKHRTNPPKIAPHRVLSADNKKTGSSPFFLSWCPISAPKVIFNLSEIINNSVLCVIANG
ncbi:MAG TPA: hypothetical protein PLD79_03385, partial [Halothiobacillus sp.]|nr:hypothetical protein [Halothiobacillus sp.]